MAEEKQTNQIRFMELDARQREHETMCEERWKTCFHRLGDLDNAVTRLETILIGVAGTIIVGGAGVILTILMMH